MLCCERALACAGTARARGPHGSSSVSSVPSVSAFRRYRNRCHGHRRFAVTADQSSSSTESSPSSTSWHKLSPRWEADEESAMEGELLDLLSPAWRIMLLSDGSVTRHLRLLCPKLNCTMLELVKQGPVGTFQSAGGSDAMPNDVSLIKGNLVQREVLLRISEDDECGDVGEDDGDGDGGDISGDDKNKQKTTPAVYAASWWSSDDFEKYMTNCESPMWTNLRTQNVELYREVRRVYFGDSDELENIFNCRGPFWGRHYIFWRDARPMTVVYEVFNPKLEKQLGPSTPC